MLNTSWINTLILLVIIGLSVTIYLNIKKSAPTQLSKLSKTYENLCSNGLDVVIPAGSLFNQKFLTSTLKLPNDDTTVKINIDCD